MKQEILSLSQKNIIIDYIDSTYFITIFYNIYIGIILYITNALD